MSNKKRKTEFEAPLAKDEERFVHSDGPAPVKAMQPMEAKREADRTATFRAGSISDCLRQLRLDQRKTTRDIAQQTGKSHSYIALIETGQRHPSMAILQSLAQIYGVESGQLLRMAGYLHPMEGLLPLTSIDRAFDFVMRDPEISGAEEAKGMRDWADIIAQCYAVDLYRRVTGRQLFSPEEHQRVCEWLPLPSPSLLWPWNPEQFKSEWAHIQRKHYQEEEQDLWQPFAQVARTFGEVFCPKLAKMLWTPQREIDFRSPVDDASVPFDDNFILPYEPREEYEGDEE